jgi:putative copper resistance protein D
VIELANFAVRWTLYAALTPLFGTALFGLYVPHAGGGRPVRRLLAVAALTALAASLAGVSVQTAMMTGSASGATDIVSLSQVLRDTATGHAALARLAAIILALCVVGAGRLSAARLSLLAALGAVALGSLAWNGHGVMNDGVLGAAHLGADILHLLAAGAWLGALLPLCAMLLRPADSSSVAAALARFSALGPIVVGVVLASGLVNGWFLVGPAHLEAVLTSAYGRLLLAKVALFVAMLVLAALHRFRLAPALAGGAPPSRVLRALRLSMLTETALGLAVLGLVSVLGSLEPPVSLG